MKYLLFIVLFFFTLFYSCNNSYEQEREKTDLSDFGLLKPKSIIPMGEPEIHTVNFDSLEEIKFSVTVEQPKIGEKFLNPQLASYSPVIKTTLIDSSGMRTMVLGRDVPFPKTYTIPKSGYLVQHGDTIHAPVKKRAKHLESQTIGAMKLVSNSIKDIRYLDENAGLPQSSFQCVMEDSKGYIWLGSTGVGLVRYDGNDLLHYNTNQGLYGPRVYSMLEDSEQNLWIGFKSTFGAGYENGITKYDGVNFVNYDTNQGFANSAVAAFYEDRHGALWLATEKHGVIVYKKNNTIETITRYTKKNGLLSNKVYSLFEDKDGLMWIGTNEGVCTFDGKKITSFSQKKDQFVKSILQDSKGNIWYSNLSSICKYNGKSILEYQGGKYTTVISSMVIDDQGIIWVGNYGSGLTFFDGVNYGMIDTENGLPHPGILNISKDKKGNIWISTQGGGVYKLKVNSFNNNFSQAGLTNKRVNSFTSDTSGNIWISGINLEGIIKYNNEHSQHYYIKGAKSRFIYKDNTNNLWFASIEGKPYDFTKFDGNNAYRYQLKDFDEANRIMCTTQDANGAIWLGAIDGLYKLDGDRMVRFSKKEGVPARIIKMDTDKKGNLWLCTRNGLSMFDGKRFYNYNESNGLFKNRLSNFMIDSHGNIFVSSVQGLSLITVNNDDLSLEYSYNYGDKNNLEKDISLTLLEDTNNNIWAGTKVGVNKLTPTDQLGVYEKISFTKEDGYLAKRGLINSVFLDKKNNTICWGVRGGRNGIVSLNLDKYNLKHNKPKIHLNEININNEFIDFNNLEDTTYTKSIPFVAELKEGTDGIVKFQNYPKQLELPYSLNHLKFKFSGTDWKSPEAIQYQYILEGSDKYWSSLTTDNFAEYKKLSHGNYTFKVRAIGKTGLKSDVFSYAFSITPPWWHTWWARFFYLLLGVFFIYVIVKLRTNALRKEFAEKERLWAITDKQNKRFKDFSFITSHNIRIAATNFTGLLGLIRQQVNPQLLGMLDMLDATNYKLGNSIDHMNQLLHTDDFNKAIEKESYYFTTAINKAIEKNKSLVNKQQAIIKIDIPEDLEVLTLYKYLDNIVHQLIKNALIFGVTASNKTIEIFTQKEDENTVFVVKDYGLGIDLDAYQNDMFSLGARFHPEHSEGEGLGLYISKNQINTLGWDIKIESSVNKGSTFKVICYE